ncbi:hypothetical protein PVNG_04503 [Plasmodium vivax North Korean]|uniref:Uncharacterized protein n=1 Tax=Plasmodium vivax North Korean TaxID=1035514 RepID=A0A0J9U0C1_PLAVI|nr:hypothetical protein PVNG_04503 [Plasmodium vivax North Korean]
MPNETHDRGKTKKHHLDNVEKTLQKSNVDCVSYVYKNMNDQTTSKNVASSIKLGGGEGRVDAVRKMLLFEKRPKKNVTIGASRTSAATGGDGPCAKDDETVHSLILSTFINTKLRQTHNHAGEAVNRPKKVKLAKQPPGGNNKKGEYAKRGERLHAIRSEVTPASTHQTADAYRQNLTAEVTKVICTHKDVQITETDEELKNLKNDGTFLYEQVISEREKKKKVNSTQTSPLYQEDEIKCFAKYMAKQIVNEATIQLTYEENVKAMEDKKKAVQLNHRRNLQTYSHLTDFQRDNLGVLADGAELSSRLFTLGKINTFGLSGSLIKSLVRKNVEAAKEQVRCLHILGKINTFGLSGSLIKSLVRKNVEAAKEQNKRDQIEWNNDVIKNLLKNTIAFVATEKIVSFIAEELIEDCVLNFCRLDKRDVDILRANLEENKISLYERRRMEGGHFNFVLSNGNLHVNIPLRVGKHTSLEDLLRRIKNHIKKEMNFLRKEYKLDCLCIRDGTRSIASIHELLSSESCHFTICLNRKEGEVLPTR